MPFNCKCIKKMKILTVLIFVILSLSVNSFPIPKENKAVFDLIRKNKIIGSIETKFDQKDNFLIVETNVNIEVKALFLTIYKFIQSSKETWSNGEFIEFIGHTDFEDEREYFITGKDINNKFIATGMDGEIIDDINILPLNYWYKKILLEDLLFTQLYLRRIY